MIRIAFSTVLTLFIIALSFGHAYAEDSELANLFHVHDVEGTIVLSSLDGQTEHVHNNERAEKRFLPASTFKLPNTLIALDEGAIADEEEIIKWDGKEKGWAPWNKDHSLTTALPVSCIWFYQELAKRVGMENYLSHLNNLNYGNRKTGPDLTTFWLDGELKISAVEQVQFLKKLYTNNLPYSQNYLHLLKELMVVDKNPNHIIRAKTGWATRIKNQQGWYVGYVEAKGQVWFFATNVAIKKKSDANSRKIITMQALRLKGII